MIKTAITLVRLRWTLTLATLRKSACQPDFAYSL